MASFLTDAFLVFGRIVETSLNGAKRAIVANLAGHERAKKDGNPAQDSSVSATYGPIGYYARPLPPVDAQAATGLKPAGAAEFVGVRSGDEIVPLVARDLRLNAQVNPKEGSIGLIQYGGGFIDLSANADGNGTTITIYALRKKTDGTADKASVITVDTAAGNASIALVHELGHSVLLNKDGSVILMNKNGDAMVEVNDAGVTINAAQTAITGGAMLGDKNPALGDFVALAAKVLTELGNIKTAFDGHTHTVPITGPPGTTASAPPINPMPAPASVAATQVKAK